MPSEIFNLKSYLVEPDRRAAGEEHAADVRVSDEVSARLRAALDEVDHARRQAGRIAGFGQEPPDERRLFAGLQDGGVAREQGGALLVPGIPVEHRCPNASMYERPELKAQAGRDMETFRKKWGRTPW